MSDLNAQRASVRQDEVNRGEDAAVEAAIRVHEWVQSEILRLAKALRGLERGPSVARNTTPIVVQRRRFMKKLALVLRGPTSENAQQ